METAQTSDAVQVDQAGGSDLFELARIALRRKFEAFGDHAPPRPERRPDLDVPVATAT